MGKSEKRHMSVAADVTDKSNKKATRRETKIIIFPSVAGPKKTRGFVER